MTMTKEKMELLLKSSMSFDDNSIIIFKNYLFFMEFISQILKD